MSRQSLRSQKISGMYDFGYSISNLNANSQALENINNGQILTNQNAAIVIVDKEGQSETTYGTRPVSIGSNVGKILAIGFECANNFQDNDSICIGKNNCLTNQANLCVTIGSYNVKSIQSISCMAIGHSNFYRPSGSTTQGFSSSVIGNNNNGLSNASYFAIGNNNKLTGYAQFGFNQNISETITPGITIGTDMEINGNDNVNLIVIGNDIKFTSATSDLAANQSIIAIGNDINPVDDLDGALFITAIGNNLMKTSAKNTLVIGNNSSQNLQNEFSISIGNYNGQSPGLKSTIIGNFICNRVVNKKNNILIGSGINISSPNSLVINTYSTDYEISPDNFSKFILRAPIRGLAHGIGLNKLHYNPITEELTYSIN